jgi:hypothetical protein
MKFSAPYRPTPQLRARIIEALQDQKRCLVNIALC